MNLDKVFITCTLRGEYEALPPTESHLVRYLLRTEDTHPTDPLSKLVYLPSYLGEPGHQQGHVLLGDLQEELARYLEMPVKGTCIRFWCQEGSLIKPDLDVRTCLVFCWGPDGGLD